MAPLWPKVVPFVVTQLIIICSVDSSVVLVYFMSNCFLVTLIIALTIEDCMYQDILLCLCIQRNSFVNKLSVKKIHIINYCERKLVYY